MKNPTPPPPPCGFAAGGGAHRPAGRARKKSVEPANGITKTTKTNHAGVYNIYTLLESIWSFIGGDITPLQSQTKFG
jgi:hypothetical protein